MDDFAREVLTNFSQSGFGFLRFLSLMISMICPLCTVESRDVILPSTRAPVAEFTATVAALAVQFANASIADGATVSFHWDFGDGATSSDKTPTHTYAAAGTYTVTLEVVAGALAATKSQAVVTVDDPTQPTSDGGCQSNAPAGGALAVFLAAVAVGRHRRRQR